MDEALSSFIKKGPNSKNLKNTKTSIRASFIKGLQRIGGFGGKSDYLAYSEVYTGDPGRFNTFYSDMLSTTKQELQKTASDWLTDGVYVLVVQPEEKHTFERTPLADRSKLPKGDSGMRSFVSTMNPLMPSSV